MARKILKLKPGEEAEYLAKLDDFDRIGKDGQHNWRERAKEYRKYYRGSQWDEIVRAKLESEGKPCLTINHIKPTLDFMSGIQRQNRKDVKFRPRRRGKEEIANLYTALFHHAVDNADGDVKASECFDKGNQMAKGWLFFEIASQENPFDEEAGIEYVPSLEVEEDPNAKEYEINDSGKFLTRKKWVDRDEIESRYPEKKELLANELGTEGGGPGSGHGLVQVICNFLLGDNFQDADDEDEGEFDEKREEDRRKYRYRLKRTWWFEYGQATAIIDRRNGEVKYYDQATEKKEIERAQTMAERYGEVFEIKTGLVHKCLYEARRVGSVILEIIKDPYNGMHKFPGVRYCPFWDDGYALGVIDNLTSPQNEINKRRSQTLHLLNQTANAGWIARKLDGGYEKILKMFGATPGVVLETDKCGGSLTKIEPNQINKGLLTLGEMGADDIKNISGVNTASMGQEGPKQESGRLNELKQRQGLTVTEKLFDNFDRTMKAAAALLLEMIIRNQVYTEEEIRQIIEEDQLVNPEIAGEIQKQLEQLAPPPPEPDPVQMVMLPPEMQAVVIQKYQQAVQKHQEQLEPMIRRQAVQQMLSQLGQWQTGQYQAAVAQSPNSPTQKVARMTELEALNQAYPGIVPPKVLIEATDLDSGIKDEMIKLLPAPQPTAA